jgi:hypothetical protein
MIQTKSNNIVKNEEILGRMSKEEIDNLFSISTDTTNTKPKRKKKIKQPSGIITWKWTQSR